MAACRRSRCCSASTRRSRSTTTCTAASCRSCCASSSLKPRSERAAAPRPSPTAMGRSSAALTDRVAVTLVGCFLMLQPMSTDFYLASLPGLAQRFAASVATVQLTLSVFILAFGTMQLVIGPLSDRVGRFPVAIAGLALYAGASLACALAPSIEFLIAARFLQEG